MVVDIAPGDGDFVEEDLDEFIKEIKSLNNGKAKKVALNMKNKKFLNSSGLGEMIKVKDILLDDGMELILIALAPRIESLIDMVGLNNFFTIVSTEKDI